MQAICLILLDSNIRHRSIQAQGQRGLILAKAWRIEILDGEMNHEGVQGVDNGQDLVRAWDGRGTDVGSAAWQNSLDI